MDKFSEFLESIYTVNPTMISGIMEAYSLSKAKEYTRAGKSNQKYALEGIRYLHNKVFGGFGKRIGKKGELGDIVIGEGFKPFEIDEYVAERLGHSSISVKSPDDVSVDGNKTTWKDFKGNLMRNAGDKQAIAKLTRPYDAMVDKSRGSKAYRIIMSNHPYDIAGMSEARKWQDISCKRFGGGHQHNLLNEVGVIGIVYVIEVGRGGELLSDPILRRLLIPMKVVDSAMINFASPDRPYIDQSAPISEELLSEVSDRIETYLRSKDAYIDDQKGQFPMGVYNDTDAGSAYKEYDAVKSLSDVMSIYGMDVVDKYIKDRGISEQDMAGVIGTKHQPLITKAFKAYVSSTNTVSSGVWRLLYKFDREYAISLITGDLAPYSYVARNNIVNMLTYQISSGHYTGKDAIGILKILESMRIHGRVNGNYLIVYVNEGDVNTVEEFFRHGIVPTNRLVGDMIGNPKFGDELITWAIKNLDEAPNDYVMEEALLNRPLVVPLLRNIMNI